MALSGCDVQGGVPSGGGQVGVGIIFQQELHHVGVANASCTVKWGLVILESEVKKKNGVLLKLPDPKLHFTKEEDDAQRV